jgi:hypothetical protein
LLVPLLKTGSLPGKYLYSTHNKCQTLYGKAKIEMAGRFRELYTGAENEDVEEKEIRGVTTKFLDWCCSVHIR